MTRRYKPIAVVSLLIGVVAITAATLMAAGIFDRSPSRQVEPAGFNSAEVEDTLLLGGDFAFDTQQDTGTVYGMIVDADGNGVEANILLCGTACWPAASEKDGSFVFFDVPAEGYLVDARSVGGCMPEEKLPVMVEGNAIVTMNAPVVLANC